MEGRAMFDAYGNKIEHTLVYHNGDYKIWHDAENNTFTTQGSTREMACQLALINSRYETMERQIIEILGEFHLQNILQIGDRLRELEKRNG